MIARVAMLSLHSSPLDQPGTGSSGGMNVYVDELAHALAAGDIAVDVFTRSPDGLQVVEAGPGVRVIGVPAGPTGSIDKGALADYAPAMLSGIQAIACRDWLRYDLVHSHYWISGLVGQRLARTWAVPHVQMFHTFSRIKSAYAGSTPDPRRACVEARLLDSADAVVVSNPVERTQAIEQYGPRRAPLVSIPCGIDPAPFAQARRSAPCRADGRFVVAALGRLERLKNFPLLLQGFALACERNPAFGATAEVRIAGGASGEEPGALTDLQALARDLGIGGQVQFPGPVPHHDVPAFYAGADVCVVPSRHESFGLVALEAMATGLPVVATRAGGLQVTVIDGVNGYLVDVDDAPSLADRLLALWSSPALRAAMGDRGARAAQHHAWPLVAERVRCLYESLPGGRQATSAS